MVQMQQITFASSYGGHTSWSAADVEYDRPLDPWNKEMRSLSSNVLLYSSKTIKYHGSLSSINWNCYEEKGDTTNWEMYYR